MIRYGIEEKIGNTPTIRLRRTEERFNLSGHLYGKLEFQNPSGSVKDRAALEMIKEGVSQGRINKDSCIVEPTSGNLGISIAMISAAWGYHAVIVMPKGMSRERGMMISAYGGEIIEVSGGMSEAIEEVEKYLKEHKNCVTLGQFTNKSNILAHYLTTGPEIFHDTDGEIDIVVAGVGSGGTISGVGAYLKSKKPSVRVVAVEPKNSAVLSGGEPGLHRIQGIGAGFLPPLYNKEVVDELITVADEDAFCYTRMLAREEGIFAGISSGAAFFAAMKLALREENRGKKILFILPDRGDRYFSTKFFY